MYRIFDYFRHRARVRMLNHDQAWGKRGEDVAYRYLKSQGYIMIARNYRTRAGSGEVDLIGWDGDNLVFVEVKARATDEYGTPESAVDGEKQRKIMIASRDYARRAGIKWERARFDIVSIVWFDPPLITLLKDAFASVRAMSTAL